LYKSTGIVGKIALWLAANLSFTISGIFFQVLSLKQSLNILKGLNFSPFIFYFLVYVVFTFGATR